MSATYETNWMSDLTRPTLPCPPRAAAAADDDGGAAEAAIEVPFGLDGDGAAPSTTASA